MKIVVVTDDGNEHETELPAEFICHSDIADALKFSTNPADVLAMLACAGSKAIRKDPSKFENDPILKAVIENDRKFRQPQPP